MTHEPPAELAAYDAQTRLVASIRERAQVWRLLIGFPVILVVTYALIMVGFAAMGALGFDTAALSPASERKTALDLTTLFTFAALSIAVGLVVRLLQGRNLLSVIGTPRRAVRQFARVFVWLLALLPVLFALPPISFGQGLSAGLPLSTWVSLLPLSLLAVLIQTSAEEILVRGYLQQSLAARFSQPLIWMGLPSVLFALAHFDPRFIDGNAWIIVIWAGVFGMCMADVTARAGTLGPAIAIHFFNNILAILLVSIPGPLDGLALFHHPFGAADTAILRQWLLVDLLMILVFWLIARLALRR